MTHKHEHRDVYIAAAVGGLGLILVLLYLFGGKTASAATNAAGTPIPGTTETAPPGISDYNYNIAPFNPDPVIPNGRVMIPANNNGNGGCCNDCGPSSGSQFNNVNVAQFQTLIGTGAG